MIIKVTLTNKKTWIKCLYFFFFFFSLSIRTCFVLFEVILSVIFYKIRNIIFASANLAPKFSAVNVLSSGVLIYVLWSSILFSTAVRAVKVARWVILGILILTSFILALRAAVVDKLVILGISFLTSFTLSLIVLVANIRYFIRYLIWGILSSISLILALQTSYFQIIIFTTLLSLLTSTGTGTNLSTSNLSTPGFKLANSVFLATPDASTPVAFFNLHLLHNKKNLIQLSHLLLKILVLENIHSFMFCRFYQSNC